jgi:hypothetical protein
MKIKTLFFALILLGCGGKSENNSSQDRVALDSVVATPVVVSPTQTTITKTVTQNFSYQPDVLTQDERETKIWAVLQPLIAQYDTTSFHTISKSRTLPGTTETDYGTLTTSETLTVTLYYNDAQELKAVKREYNYEIGGPTRYERTYTLYLFDDDWVGVYEDGEVSREMASNSYLRAATKACPDCSVRLFDGVGGNGVAVTGQLTVNDIIQLSNGAQQEAASILDYAYADSFASSGDEYVYQTVEPLNEDADYDVFYTASKGYYEKFMKPKLNR